MLIPRPGPLRWLQDWRDRDVIKVVTGVRRCGKSTILSMFRENLLASGVDPARIVSLNLENPAHAPLLADYRAFYEQVKAQLAPDGTTYVFIDEIQNADQFERVVDGLFILPEVDLYLTGSSSRLLSGSMATMLTGRYVELRLLPLSFAEYVAAQSDGQHDPPLRDLFDSYQRRGSFPFVTTLTDDDQVRQYLEGILSTILLNDVAVSQRVSNVAQLRSVTEFIFANVGNLTSTKRISDAMTSAGRSISRPTVDSYLTGLADSFLILPARRWDIRGKRLLESGEKHYLVDPGMRRAILGAKPADAGHLLENIVYLELLRRPGKVFVGKIGPGEVDFVVEDATGTTYYQVAQDVTDPATLERELASLRAIPGYEQRILLTLDREPPQSYDGIRRLSVLDWLIDAD
ncbi:MAG: ATP-binding protein [Propionibacteriaceae bacterium]|jgi:predicted AAA+ superfamily ATPase|nr:ATP-binding protein [Propionibacteriaceae bacterium]